MTTFRAAHRELLSTGRALRARIGTEDDTPGDGLSKRERAVGELLVEGLTHKEIGARLYISPKTAEQHVAKIRQKLSVGGQAELMASLRAIGVKLVRAGSCRRSSAVLAVGQHHTAWASGRRSRDLVVTPVHRRYAVIVHRDGGAGGQDLSFGLLGDVEVRLRGVPVPLGHARQRAVLAALAVDAARPVSTDRLVDRVWGERVPTRAHSALRTYLSHLRRALAPTGVTIERDGVGYVLGVAPDVVDVNRFGDLAARARQEGDPWRAAALAEEALALWRGEPLAELDTPWASSVRERLNRERASLDADRIDRTLALGRHDELLPDLFARVAQDGLDERAAGQLVLALYRCGRQADALDQYRLVRQRLAEELGIDPGPALQALHQRVLTSDPTLAAGEPLAETTPVPRQLPVPPRLFTGRDDHLASLLAALDAPEDGTVVVTVSGAGGIGKTWLALHWAHRYADRFPDGQLFADLRGFGPDGSPLPPAVVVRGFLAALGVDAGRLPADQDAQAALFRSTLADKRVLLVLDNVADTSQVTPLLPGGRTCAVLVTSRNHLLGLVTAHGAHHLALDVLTDDESRALLIRRLGATRVAADPEAVTGLIGLCGGFPLALGIIAARAHTQPHIPLAEFTGELRELGLDALVDQEPAASLPTVLSWSRRALTDGQAALFSLLGLAPGADIGLHAAANLAGLPIARARAELRALEQASLIGHGARGRYRMHDLVRAHAVEQAPTASPDSRAALIRLTGHYRHAAAVAMDVLYPAEKHRRPATPAFDGPMPSLATADAARAWLDAERDNLIDIAAHAADHGLHEHAVHLAGTVWRHLDVTGQIPAALALCGHGLRAARAAGDRVWEARIMLHTGTTRVREGWGAIVGDLRSCLEIARETGDAVTESQVRSLLGWTLAQDGRNEEALDHLQRALALARDLDDDGAVGRVLNNMGVVYHRQGRYEELLVLLREALEQARSAGSRVTEAKVLGNIGVVHVERRDHAQALDSLEQAIVIHRETGNRTGEGIALINTASARHHGGDHEHAYRDIVAALTILRETGDRSAVESALNGAGEVALKLDRPDEAAGFLHEALTRTEESGNRFTHARAQAALGDVHLARDDVREAERLWRLSLATLTDLGAAEADHVAKRLADLGEQ
ncbi:BTAD domain-containing putative transcriptional regulator [Lentzea sp. NPDC005914]|uniref:BTAD domain-containing putative transcriptional regulator n=1 Tax=Lentzea sp. NPDC005914 TaxID=3154572 RepID=UPI0033D90425